MNEIIVAVCDRCEMVRPCERVAGDWTCWECRGEERPPEYEVSDDQLTLGDAA